MSSAFAAPFSALLTLAETFFVFSCTLGGSGAPLSHLGLDFAFLSGHVFRTRWHLGFQFVDSWAPFGRRWDLSWCIFMALGPDPGLLFRLFWKRLENDTKKERKRKLK